jgi:hypothetical protein
MIATLVANLFAWALVIGIAAAGMVITVLGTARTYRTMKRDGRSTGASTVVASLAAVVLFLGGWLFLGLYWLAARVGRVVLRST